MDKKNIEKHLLRMMDIDENKFESLYGVSLQDMVDFIVDSDERQRAMTEVIRNNTLDSLIN